MALSSMLSGLRRDNRRMLGKLGVIALAMFGFGYALVPMYRTICDALGINVLSVSERVTSAGLASAGARKANTQVDTSRTITIEFDANSRGPWDFKPAVNSLKVHPGEMATVMYEFRNRQDRTMAAQAIPSYAPMQASAHFNKLECFCFNEYTLKPGERKEWPVVMQKRWPRRRRPDWNRLPHRQQIWRGWIRPEWPCLLTRIPIAASRWRN